MYLNSDTVKKSPLAQVMIVTLRLNIIKTPSQCQKWAQAHISLIKKQEYFSIHFSTLSLEYLKGCHMAETDNFVIVPCGREIVSGKKLSWLKKDYLKNLNYQVFKQMTVDVAYQHVSESTLPSYWFKISKFKIIYAFKSFWFDIGSYILKRKQYNTSNMGVSWHTSLS